MGICWKNLGAYETWEQQDNDGESKTMYRMRTGDFVFNCIDADKDASFVVGDELHGGVASYGPEKVSSAITEDVTY